MYVHKAYQLLLLALVVGAIVRMVVSHLWVAYTGLSTWWLDFTLSLITTTYFSMVELWLGLACIPAAWLILLILYDLATQYTIVVMALLICAFKYTQKGWFVFWFGLAGQSLYLGGPSGLLMVVGMLFCFLWLYVLTEHWIAEAQERAKSMPPRRPIITISRDDIALWLCGYGWASLLYQSWQSFSVPEFVFKFLRLLQTFVVSTRSHGCRLLKLAKQWRPRVIRRWKEQNQAARDRWDRERLARSKRIVAGMRGLAAAAEQKRLDKRLKEASDHAFVMALARRSRSFTEATARRAERDLEQQRQSQEEQRQEAESSKLRGSLKPGRQNPELPGPVPADPPAKLLSPELPRPQFPESSKQPLPSCQEPPNAPSAPTRRLPAPVQAPEQYPLSSLAAEETRPVPEVQPDPVLDVSPVQCPPVPVADGKLAEHSVCAEQLDVWPEPMDLDDDDDVPGQQSLIPASISLDRVNDGKGCKRRIPEQHVIRATSGALKMSRPIRPIKKVIRKASDALLSGKSRAFAKWRVSKRSHAERQRLSKRLRALAARLADKRSLLDRVMGNSIFGAWKAQQSLPVPIPAQASPASVSFPAPVTFPVLVAAPVVTVSSPDVAVPSALDDDMAASISTLQLSTMDNDMQIDDQSPPQSPPQLPLVPIPTPAPAMIPMTSVLAIASVAAPVATVPAPVNPAVNVPVDEEFSSSFSSLDLPSEMIESTTPPGSPPAHPVTPMAEVTYSVEGEEDVGFVIDLVGSKGNTPSGYSACETTPVAGQDEPVNAAADDDLESTDSDVASVFFVDVEIPVSHQEGEGGSPVDEDGHDDDDSDDDSYSTLSLHSDHRFQTGEFQNGPSPAGEDAAEDEPFENEVKDYVPGSIQSHCYESDSFVEYLRSHGYPEAEINELVKDRIRMINGLMDSGSGMDIAIRDAAAFFEDGDYYDPDGNCYTA